MQFMQHKGHATKGMPQGIHLVLRPVVANSGPALANSGPVLAHGPLYSCALLQRSLLQNLITEGPEKGQRGARVGLGQGPSRTTEARRRAAFFGVCFVKEMS